MSIYMYIDYRIIEWSGAGNWRLIIRFGFCFALSYVVYIGTYIYIIYIPIILPHQRNNYVLNEPLNAVGAAAVGAL